VADYGQIDQFENVCGAGQSLEQLYQQGAASMGRIRELMADGYGTIVIRNPGALCYHRDHPNSPT